MTPRRWLIATCALAAIVSGLSWYFSRPDPMLAVVVLQGERGHGTGFAIDPHTVVSNRHVVEGREMSVATLTGGTARVDNVWLSEETDIAVLTVSPALPHTLSVTCEWPAFGQGIKALGHPLGALWAENRGYVASPLPWQSDDRFVVLDVALAEGMSGGPVLNRWGEVVAVNVAYSAVGAASVSLGIPGDLVCRAIEQAKGGSNGGM